MTYKKLITDPIPEYSKGEEIFNYVSHIVGGSIGIFMIIFSSICFGVKNLNLSEYLSVLTYSIIIILLYTISTLYHALSKKLIAKRIFRILDHCTIYFLIAGRNRRIRFYHQFYEHCSNTEQYRTRLWSGRAYRKLCLL